MRLLVTGGAGFIGANLCRSALTNPAIDRVVVLDDLSTGTEGNLAGLDVELVRGSVLNESTLDKACSGADAVVHLAAIPSVPRSIADPWPSHEANATGTLRLLEAVRRNRVPHVVVASSSSVYGANPELPKHERSWTRPLSPYAASKLATEAYALAYQAAYGLPVLALRFFNVYGPRQSARHAYAAVVPRFLDAILHGRPVELYGDGEQSRDFTYVGTTCQVLLAAAVRQVRCDSPVNLAFGERISLLRLLDELRLVLGREIAAEHRPARVGDVRHSCADGTLLRELFPEVTAVPLPQGLRETAAWFATQLADG
jgi:UDP-glucose 4-epimerase